MGYVDMYRPFGGESMNNDSAEQIKTKWVNEFIICSLNMLI